MPQTALHRGRVVARYAKHHLPNYGVFDEFRIFVPGTTLTVVRVRGVDVALAICEDLWQDGGPVAKTRDAGAELLLVDQRLAVRAQQGRHPAGPGRPAGRRGRLHRWPTSTWSAARTSWSSTATRSSSTCAARCSPARRSSPRTCSSSTSTCGRHGSDGRRRRATSSRRTARPRRSSTSPLSATRCPRTPAPTAPVAERLDDVAEVYAALVPGLRDYVRKNGFRSVVLGLSGGIDSALVAALAADALGGDNVVGVSMPSGYSSEHSRDDAADLAERIGADYRVQPIAPMVDAFLAELGARPASPRRTCRPGSAASILMGLSNSRATWSSPPATRASWPSATPPSTATASAASRRSRTSRRRWSGSWPAGATPRRCGAARRRRSRRARSSSRRRPSCGPARSTRTRCRRTTCWTRARGLRRAGDRGARSCSPPGSTRPSSTRWCTLVDRAEWKRRQFAPGPKISLLAFGRDRRLPVTSRWREHEP